MKQTIQFKNATIKVAMCKSAPVNRPGAIYQETFFQNVTISHNGRQGMALAYAPGSMTPNNSTLGFPADILAAANRASRDFWNPEKAQRIK
jgi:hypothetical protein